MKQRALPLSDRYDPTTQQLLRYEAAQLDDQLRDLKETVAGLEVEHLEWQAEPGRNTIGMLLAHIAVAEAFWTQVAVAGLHGTPAGNERMREVIGIRKEEDGMPLQPDGLHPETLSGMRLQDYFAMLDDMRKATHATLSGWKDAELEQSFDVGDHRVSRAWTVYHILEHLTAHLGQIRVLKRETKDAGVLA